MKNNMLPLLLTSSFLILLVSCKTSRIESLPATETAIVPAIAEITAMPTYTARATAKATSTPMSFSIPSSTTSSWVVWTPQVTVSIPMARTKVEELLKTNGGCQLPCWWGIEPGKSSFSTAIKDLSPLATQIAVKNLSDNGSLIADLKFPAPESTSTKFLSHRYQVEKYTIQQLEVMPGKTNRYLFGNLLNDYGEPEEIWVEGLIDPSSNNPFSIFFYYPQKGILAFFSLEATDLGENLQLCPGSISPTLLVLWHPEARDSFIEFVGKTHNLAYLKEENRILLPLQDTTKLKLDKIKQNNCFETPKKIWPVR